MEHVHIRVVRRFAFPRDAAYAWLTDFDASDAHRAGAVIEKRDLVERAKDRYVYDGEQSVLGARTSGRYEVQLSPPDRWESRTLTGARKGSFNHYHLVPTAGGCELTIDYHLTFEDKRRVVLLRLAKPFVRREIGKMWDGFEASMREDLTSRTGTSASTPAR